MLCFLNFFYMGFNSKMILCQERQPTTFEEKYIPGTSKSHSPVDISTVRDLVKISYPKVLKNRDISTYYLKNILLTRPKKIDRDGIYIWRDPVGIWNIRAFGDVSLNITGTISGVGSFEQKCNIGNGMHFDSEEKNTAKILGSSVSQTSGVQFKANGVHVIFDFLIDGQHNPAQIYLGANGKNPESIPFILENRPIGNLKNSSESNFLKSRSEKFNFQNVNTTKIDISKNNITKLRVGGKTRQQK